ncbi:type II secretion system minor pseudopilin GspH [Marinobacter sp. HN1S83]|uniref:type II secretion system minor pseudopilin GspH n=1 Tax=Marinobacter sp. HN1S83 TaxID=3382301 RepID=UPI00387B0177
MIKRASASGFTLIEILVVLIVVGLLAALAVLNLGGGSQQREMENHVREMFLLMQTASEQAVLNNKELGLLLEEGSYRFVTLNEQANEWTQPGERMFRQRSFPDWLLVTEFIESDTPRLASEEDKLRPDIVFFSSGETTPFEVEFTIGSDSSYMHVLASDGISPLEWRRPGGDEEEQ